MKQFEIVRSAIERDIHAGRFPVSEPLPRLEELAAEQACSVATVRRAMRDLIDAGVVESAKKRGTVVLRKPAMGRVVLFLSHDPHTNVILLEPICNALSQASFDLDLMAGGVGETALRHWCRRLTTDDRRIDAMVWLGAQGADMLEEAPVLTEAFPRQIRVAVDGLGISHVPHTAWVVPDLEGEARVLIDHLRELGHRRIAIFAGHLPSEDGWYRQLADRVRELWEEQGGERCWLHYGGRSHQAIIERVREEGLTAYIDLNDNTAIGTLASLQGAGIEVPGDISVIGRHDTPWAANAHPTLTSLSLNPEGFATQIVQAVRDLTDDPATSATYPVETFVVPRKSSAPPA